MVVCIECYVGESNGHEGVKLEQPIWITAEGPQPLAQYPLETEWLYFRLSSIGLGIGVIDC